MKWVVRIALLVGGAAAVVAITRGIGIGASRRPLFGEAPAARVAWRWLVPNSIRTASNPVPSAAIEVQTARAHWADHCAICHGNDGSGNTTFGHRLYPPAPDMRVPPTQSLTDGELFYAIEQGIPWTAMPGWANGTADGERESWQLVRFIRHLPAITAEELEEMERYNPKSPVDVQREREIDDFLKGPVVPETGRGGGRP